MLKENRYKHTRETRRKRHLSWCQLKVSQYNGYVIKDECLSLLQTTVLSSTSRCTLFPDKRPCIFLSATVKTSQKWFMLQFHEAKSRKLSKFTQKESFWESIEIIVMRNACGTKRTWHYVFIVGCSQWHLKYASSNWIESTETTDKIQNE